MLRRGEQFMEYKTLADETLVELYNEAHDEEAFNELFKRYEHFLEKQAEQSALRANLDRHSVHHKFVYKFWKAAQKYDPTRGASFKTFLYGKLSKAVYEVLRVEKYRKKTDENGRLLLKEQPLSDASLEEVTVEIELTDQVVVQDILNFLRTKGEVYPIVLKLLMEGYTYEEIGAKLKRPGSRAAVRNWGKRLKARIKEYVAEYYQLANA